MIKTVTVSDNFKSLAQQNGRHIYCKILVGNETFLDDRLIEFDFDDVVHPEWYTVGTVCANRFVFTVRFSAAPELRETVKPFISFDNKEWCPLGIFYVTRRYVRGNYLSIICYDKMYLLNTEYIPSEGITDTRALLADACGQAGIPYGGLGEKHAIDSAPSGCALRDVIGYAASVNGACAKIDRNGALALRAQLQPNGFCLSENSCFNISRNMSSSSVSSIIAETDTGTIESGGGGQTNRMDLYSPFMTQETADALIERFKQLKYYGADVEAQGIPFLESGDNIMLREADGTEYPIVISELELHYDGALTAKLHSKNRSDSDTVIHRSDLEKAAEELRAELSSFCLEHTNDYNLEISSVTTVAQLTFRSLKSGGFVQLNINASLTAAEGASVSILTYVNGVQLGEAAEHKPGGGHIELIHLSRIVNGLSKGRNRITVRLRAVGGTVKISAGQLTVSVSGNGITALQ